MSNIASNRRKPSYDRADWRWRQELSEKNLQVVGETLLDLLLAGHKWVHRRVETLTIIDNETVRHHLSVDFTVPRYLDTPLRTPSKERLYYLPLTMLQRRDGLMHFDVCDQHGKSMPLMLRREDSRLTAAALTIFASRVLAAAKVPSSRVRDSELGNILANVPFEEYEDAILRVAPVLFPRQRIKHSRNIAIRGREALLEDRHFTEFLALATANSIISIPYVGPLGVRQVVKLTYDENIGRKKWHELDWRHRWRFVGEWVGWASTNITCDLALTGLAESYHVQVDAPPNVEFTATKVEGYPPLALLQSRAFKTPLDAPPHSDFQRGHDRHSHLYVPRARGLTSGGTLVNMRGERESVNTIAFFASGVIALVLFAYWQDIDRLVKSSSAITLLPLVPGFLAAYLVRSGEHPLGRRLLRFPRLLLATSAMLPVAAVGAVVAMGPHSKELGKVTFNIKQQVVQSGVLTAPGLEPSTSLKHVLFGVALLASLLTGLLLVNRIFPRPGKQPRSGKRRWRRRERTRTSTGEAKSAATHPALVTYALGALTTVAALGLWKLRVKRDTQ